MVVVETIVITKIALTLKGAAAVAAHNGLTAHQLYHFASTAHSMGPVPALEALVHTLAQHAVMAELVRELGKLIIALKDGKPLAEILGAVVAVGWSVVRLENQPAALHL
jgi:hypothetical protein